MKIRKFEGKAFLGVKTSYTAIDDKDAGRIVFAIGVNFKGGLIMIDKKTYGGAKYDSPGQAMPSSEFVEVKQGKKEIIDLIFRATSIEKVSW